MTDMEFIRMLAEQDGDDEAAKAKLRLRRALGRLRGRRTA